MKIINQTHPLAWALLALMIFVGSIWLCAKAWNPFFEPFTFSADEKAIFKNIEQQLKAGNTTFTVSDVVPFEWDLVCLFYGYDVTPAIEILKQHNVTNIPGDHEQQLRAIEKKSDIRLLVFSMSGKVESIFYYGDRFIYMNGKATSLDTHHPCVTKADAFFRLEEPSNYKIIRLIKQER